MATTAAVAKDSPATRVMAGEDKAVFVEPVNVFSVKQTPVPPHVFNAEREAAFDPKARTGFIALDLGAVLGTQYPATTPLILSRYAVIRAGESLSSRFVASCEVYYVIRGSGESKSGAHSFVWAEGDVFVLPGGQETTHRSTSGDAMLYVATDEPSLAFSHLLPNTQSPGSEAVLYRKEKIDEALEDVYSHEFEKDQTGRGLFMSSAKGLPYGTLSPSLIASITTLPAGGDQRPHRHNAVAVTLSIQGEGCTSVVDGLRTDWTKPYTVMITPPCALHSLENRGSKMLKSLILQDAGLYYYLRATGFNFDT